MIDHIDRDKTNNRIENLRVVTHTQNAQNTDYSKTTSATGYRGVCWLPDKRRYLAYCGHEGKMLYIGLYKDPHTAAEAYNQTIVKLRGNSVDVNTLQTVQTVLPEGFRTPEAFTRLNLPDWIS
jgi:hypothetical protein